MPTNLPNSRFTADPAKCVACGMCVMDCPAHIITIEAGLARIAPELDEDCIGCQHCLAVCPYGAVSVAGCEPAASRDVGAFDAASLDNLIRSRRSVRQFAPGGVEPELVRRILDTVANAPTGVNIRHRRFTVILDTAVMDDFRDRAAKALVDNAALVPEESAWLVDFARDWLDDGVDGLCRGAPHMIVVTAGPEGVCKEADCLIALSYFDLYAQANGVGTTWCGMVDAILRLLPESRKWLGIPDDHEIGYAMLFGPAGVRYPRTAQHEPEDVVFVEKLR
jgi:Nitroreductase